MPKFSIIIPVYNVEKYIKKCLDSVMNQTYKDYEIIVVNDGTPDKSIELIKDYPIKIINQKNQGLSAARNLGAKKAKGDYLLFLDSDDYYNKDLLTELSKVLDNDPDVIRFQIQETFEDKSETITHNESSFFDKNGEEAFEQISKFHYVETATCYAIKREYFQKEKFEFAIGKLHEDFGLTPIMIIKAKKVNCISYVGYNYLQRTGSIMSTNNDEKIVKKTNDIYYHYNNLIKEIDKTSIDSNLFKSFLANSLILKISMLKGKDYKRYKKILSEEKVFNNLLSNSLGRKIKKVLIQLSPKLYYKIMK